MFSYIPYVFIYSKLYLHKPASLVSLASRASDTTLPSITLEYMLGPIPPASIGLGIQAASPTIAYPLATIQSLCLLTGTCQLPLVFPLSFSESGCFGFLIALLAATYWSIRL